MSIYLRKKAIKKHFNKVTESGIISNKKFWETVKPFISNKSGISNGDIVIAFNSRKLMKILISKLFNDLNTKVSTGEDKIPAKLTKLAKKHP